ncbi:MAG: AbrB/MazE/SpoVT family DNA-binding domain-containing protein [Hydrogenophaga sp.]|nr:AbrB/MazE/SpoVT family DNA-binding domain-containing protein [Hydrogenophaga sp.]
MLAKITAKNQLTLPKSVMTQLGSPDYVDVQTRDGQIVLTPVRIQRADEVRAKLAQLGITSDDVSDALVWARTQAPATAMAAEPSPRYKAAPAKRSKKSA